MIPSKLTFKGLSDAFPNSVEIDLSVLPHGIIAVTGSNGQGKSLPVSSGVLTPMGMKRMGEMHVGDEVCRPSGGFARVVGVFDQGILPIFEIRLRNGLRARSSADHLWKARSQWGGKRGAWSIVEMHRLDRTWQLPRSGAVDFQLQDVPMDAYLLGVCLGDGWLAPGGAVQFTFGDGKESIVHEFNRRAASLGVELREQRSRSGIHRRYGVVASKRRTRWHVRCATWA